MTENNKRFLFREATKHDIKVVREMIQQLGDEQNLGSDPMMPEEELINDAGLNGGRDYCHIYILELQEEAIKAAIPIGYAICFFAYSTWQGKTYFLQEFYVRPDYRRLTAGTYLFRQVASKAKEFGCKRLDFHVLAWNPAFAFYKKMGAIDLTESEEWHYYRVHKEQIEKLANELHNS